MSNDKTMASTVTDDEVTAASKLIHKKLGGFITWNNELSREILEQFAAGRVASSTPPPETAKFWCECCDGVGTIDERLGGEFFSNPKAKCPDCEGNGYVVGSLVAASLAPPAEMADDALYSLAQRLKGDAWYIFNASELSQEARDVIEWFSAELGVSKIPRTTEETPQTPAPTDAERLPVGTPVNKVGGSYQASGTIVSAFKTKGGEKRYVFEFDQPAGMLHIFGPSQGAAIQAKGGQASKSCREANGRCGMCGGDWSVCGCQGVIDRANKGGAA